MDIALGASDIGLLKKALGWAKKIDHLPTEAQIGVLLARAGRQQMMRRGARGLSYYLGYALIRI